MHEEAQQYNLSRAILCSLITSDLWLNVDFDEKVKPQMCAAEIMIIAFVQGAVQSLPAVSLFLGIEKKDAKQKFATTAVVQVAFEQFSSPRKIAEEPICNWVGLLRCLQSTAAYNLQRNACMGFYMELVLLILCSPLQ